MSGTVNISRGIFSDAAFKDEPFTEREAFMWMVMEARYTTEIREQRIGSATVRYGRGQFAASVRFMADAWKWTKSRVDRFIKRLENRDMVSVKCGTGVNVITICKYDDYQNKPSDSGTLTGQQRDSSGTAAGQQRDKPNTGEIQGKYREKELGISADAECSDFSPASDPKPVIETPPVKPKRKASTKDDPAILSELSKLAGSPAAESFAAYRRKMKAPLTVTAAKLQAKALRTIIDGGGDPVDALGMVELRGWKAIQADWYFKEKSKERGNGHVENGSNGNGWGGRNSGGSNRSGSGTSDAFIAVAARRGTGS